jgi:F0F1-type ATP synthase assembly protein I
LSGFASWAFIVFDNRVGVFKPLMRPIRIVLRWQLIVTAVLAMMGMILWGPDGAASAALGGLINVAAGWVYGWRVAQGEAKSAGEALRTMFRAEAFKVLLILVGLWVVLQNYRDIVHVAFFATFVITIGVFAAAITVPDAEEDKAPRHAGDK